MRILICSHVFAPNVGGIETVTAVLAEQFVRLGAAVTVVTQTPGDQVFSKYQVVRRPSLIRLCALARKSDVIFQNNISLRTVLPLLLCGKPIVVTHQLLASRLNGHLGWQDRLKRAVYPLCRNLAISRPVAEGLQVKSTVVGNPFEAAEFSIDGETGRKKDIVFLGRLVSDKGCEVAVRALAILRQEGICPSFTVVGDGPEMEALKNLSAELGVATQVDFRGTMLAGRGRELAEHKIMVVPSKWAEPFGIVALEGIAAGCVVVASDTGGLPEAVGSCGLLVPAGDEDALAAACKRLLADSNLREAILAGRKSHLRKFEPETVAARYMEVFQAVLKNS